MAIKLQRMRGIKIMKQKILGLLMILLIAPVFTGCKNNTLPSDLNANIVALMVSSGSLSPAFTADITEYTVNVPYGTTEITVTVVQKEDTAILSSNNGVVQDLIAGDNSITITVTAEDGSTLDYVVTVSVTPAGPADLVAIMVSKGTLSPTFATNTTEYTVSVPYNTESITVTGIQSDDTAVISANNGVSQDLNIGENPITLTVTGQDDTTIKNYIITVATDYFYEKIGILKYVPAGTFQRDGKAENTSSVSSFRMSEKEITTEQFVLITGLENPSTSFIDVVNGPVQSTSWYHALVFCNQLSIAEGLTPVYTIRESTVPDAWDGNPNGNITVPTDNDDIWNAAEANWSASGYRLPTEMEWMWAAMGATRGSGYAGPTHLTGYGQKFVGSDSTKTDGSGGTRVIGNYGWYDNNAENTTHSVGCKAPNILGLYDMSGNVSEWCWDLYEGSSSSLPTDKDGPLIDYRGPDLPSGTRRVRRGGGWNEWTLVCSVAYRQNLHPISHYYATGFRVVRP